MLALRRREFMTLIGGAAVAWPLAARGQQPTVALVGLLTGSKQDDRWLGALRQGLKEQQPAMQGATLTISPPYAGSSHVRHE